MKLVAAPLLLVLASSLASAQQIASLAGPTPSGQPFILTGVSADGASVVGAAYAGPGPGGLHSLRWRIGFGLENPSPSGAVNDYVNATSADGSVLVGMADRPGQGGGFVSWVRRDGAAAYVVPPAGYTDAYLYAVSADGRIAAGDVFGIGTPARPSRAARYDTLTRTWTILEPLPGGTTANAKSISADGSVVVGSANLGTSQRAVRWVREGAPQDLGLAPGETGAAAQGVSADGSQVFGITFVSSSPSQIFRWTPAGGTVLLGEGETVGSVSPDGRVLIGNFANGVADVWDDAHGFRSLRTVLQANGLAGAEQNLHHALALAVNHSGAGYAIAGGSAGGSPSDSNWFAVTLPSIDGVCPAFVQEPSEMDGTEPGGAVLLSATLANASGASLQWLRNGSPVGDDDRHSGAQSDTLLITGALASDSGEYRLRVTGACGEVLSTASQVTVGVSPPPCLADFNHDGIVDPDDLSDDIACYFATPACDRADFNADANVDPDDLSDFIAAYFAGC